MIDSLLEQRLNALEARLQALETRAAAAFEDAGGHGTKVPAPAPSALPTAPSTERTALPVPGDEGLLWVLGGLIRRLEPGQGGVVYAGRYNHPAGGELQWQIGRPQEALFDEDWGELAPRLAALGHPVRLRLAQLLIKGMSAVADLAAQPGMGTTGQLYHHLRELESAGWVHGPQRGHYALRPERVVALMAVVTAARH